MPNDQPNTRFPIARVAIAFSLAILLVATPSMASFFQGGGDASTDGASASIGWTYRSRDDSRNHADSAPQESTAACCAESAAEEPRPCCEPEPCCPTPSEPCCETQPPEPCCATPPPEPCCETQPPEPCCRPPSEPCCEPSPTPEPCCRTPPAPSDKGPGLFSAAFSPYRVGVEPGHSAELRLEIYNHGNDRIRVTLAKVATERGWDVSLGASDVTIASGSSFRLPVKIVSPSNGTHEGWGLVRLVANGASETTHYVTAQGFIIPPRPTHAVAVEVNPKNVEIRAGETVELRYDVRNVGTKSDSYKIALSAPPGFKIDASHTGMRLAGGEHLTGLARLTATRDAASGLLEVFVTGESGASARSAARIHVYAEPEPVRSVRLYLEGGNETNAGNTTTFFVRAQNDARTNRTVDLRPGPMPNGWTIRFEPARLFMPGGHTSMARAYVSVPDCAPAGEYHISVDGHVLEENSRVNAWAKVRVVNTRACTTA